ncbi:DUF2656 domain-containing protein [Gloeobacter kilaueensis]|uniref:DUF2656 domain-containing protein n=1 Tax=Gloeobacter kilaueensis TaxID=1416614 RepID=UPI001CB6F0CE|nr:DUF2656 domain-containing protein [Gloeobacter kilaueensis]
MGEDLQGRMLLSHNFDLEPGGIPVLSSAQFASVFIDGLASQPGIRCRYLEDSPHWLVEVLFAADTHPPARVGELCAQALADRRQQQLPEGVAPPDILALGGLKTTPARSASPYSLQPGNWGVDVVETASAETFLLAIGWEATVARLPAEEVFQVVLPGK